MHREHKKVSASFKAASNLNDSDCSEDYDYDPMYFKMPEAFLNK